MSPTLLPALLLAAFPGLLALERISLDAARRRIPDCVAATGTRATMAPVWLLPLVATFFWMVEMGLENQICQARRKDKASAAGKSEIPLLEAVQCATSINAGD